MSIPSIELCRTEIGRIADALEVLVEKHGNQKRALRESGVAREVFSRFAKRGAYERATEASLEPLARVHGISVEQLIAGKGPKPQKRGR